MASVTQPAVAGNESPSAHHHASAPLELLATVARLLRPGRHGGDDFGACTQALRDALAGRSARILTREDADLPTRCHEALLWYLEIDGSGDGLLEEELTDLLRAIDARLSPTCGLLDAAKGVGGAS